MREVVIKGFLIWLYPEKSVIYHYHCDQKGVSPLVGVVNQQEGDSGLHCMRCGKEPPKDIITLIKLSMLSDG